MPVRRRYVYLPMTLSVILAGSLAPILSATIPAAAGASHGTHQSSPLYTSKGKATFLVRIQNVSTKGTVTDPKGQPKPVPLSPGAWAVFRGLNPVFTPGGRAGEALENVAEDGFPMRLARKLSRTAHVTDSGIFKSTAGKTPALGPGETARFVIRASRGERLGFATMFVPSNDGFYAPGAAGIPLFQADGTPIRGNVTDLLVLWDAGTERNQHLYGPATKPNQPHPDYGPYENRPIEPILARHDGNTYPDTNAVIKVTITPCRYGYCRSRH